MKFSLDHARLLDFVKVSEKSIGIPDVVSIYTTDEGELYFHCLTDVGFSYINFPGVQGSIATAVEAEKFFSTIKNMYSGEISFEYEKRKLVVKKDNIEVKLASSVRVFMAIISPAYLIPPGRAGGLVKAIRRASSIVQDDSRFYGVLVDNKEPFCRVCNFSTSAITVNTLDFISEIQQKRIAITSQSVAAVGSLEKDIEYLFFSEKDHFGFRTKQGSVVYMPTVMDTYPEQYLEQLKLADTNTPINLNQFSISHFNRDQLLSAANLVSSIIGAEEASIRLSVKGLSSEGNAIWQIHSRSFTQSEVQELVESLPGSSVEQLSFTVNKKQFLKILGQLDEKVSILCSEEYSALVFYNQEGRDLVLLVKMS